MPAVNQLKENLAALDSTATGKSLIEVLTQNNKLIISLFPVSRTKMDALYVLEIRNITQHAAISNLLEENYRQKSRKYNGFTISEITHKKTGKQLSFIFYKNYFIGSATPFLVEDAIRTIGSAEYLSFREVNSELFTLTRLNNDDGNLYLNTSKISDLAGLFYLGAKSEISFFNKIAKSAFMDLSIRESDISLNGFSTVQNNSDFLNAFNNNSAEKFTVANLISNDAFLLTHLSISNPVLFLENLDVYRQQNEKDYQTALKTLSEYDINTDDFSQWLGQEIAFYRTADAERRIMIIDSKDIILAKRQLSDITKRLATANQDSVYSEVYDGNEIILFPLSNFPSLFLGDIAGGFEDVFYINYGNRLVFSNDLQHLKELIDDINNENTWGKSLKFNQFLETLNKDANLSYIFNFRNGQKILSELLNDDWKEFVSNNNSILREFELTGLQFSNVDNRYYTNINIFHPGEYTERKGSRTMRSEISLTFENQLLGKPKLITNHIDNSKEIIVQDSSAKLYLLSDDFDIIWIDSISSIITTEFNQVDYYKNNKLQLLFGAGEQVFLVDRAGKNVEGYPVKIGDSPLVALNVIDYNKTKKYRWGITNQKGEMYLLDKQGEKLKNWGPNQRNYKTEDGIRHTRILGKDLMLICQENGVLDILNRQGNSYPGFPINFEKDIDSQYILKPGTSFNKSTITLISKDGEILTLNMRGKFLRREQLILGSKDSEYSFVKDLNSSKYLIAVADRQNIIILSSDGKKKFEKNYINSGDLSMQYYNFGPGNELIIVTDRLQEFSYLYDGSGNLINSIPLENSFPVSVLYSRSRNEYQLYTSFRDRMDKYVFKIR
ncbi:MAG: hypothetical protein WBA74_20655 [Cyclobacteriaceae bacterium]